MAFSRNEQIESLSLDGVIRSQTVQSAAKWPSEADAGTMYAFFLLLETGSKDGK